MKYPILVITIICCAFLGLTNPSASQAQEIIGYDLVDSNAPWDVFFRPDTNLPSTAGLMKITFREPLFTWLAIGAEEYDAPTGQDFCWSQGYILGTYYRSLSDFYNPNDEVGFFADCLTNVFPPQIWKQYLVIDNVIYDLAEIVEAPLAGGKSIAVEQRK